MDSATIKLRRALAGPDLIRNRMMALNSLSKIKP
jgi:hypothetical protein